MHYVVGQYVKHLGQPEWGVGEIVDLLGDEKLRVYSSQAKEYKSLSRKYAQLEIVDRASASSPTIGRKINVERIVHLCDLFYSDMNANRPNCDDGGLALEIKKDLQSRGEITNRTKKRLLAWCHTDGNLYERGVEIARRICLTIYGCIPPRDS